MNAGITGPKFGTSTRIPDIRWFCCSGHKDSIVEHFSVLSHSLINRAHQQSLCCRSHHAPCCRHSIGRLCSGA
ncbi:hypothetical protein XELAEV_18016437mg [Xenopus laevis]|uniref:Uncharacterized protein n=1 Tax=Xenopus laevis TaxID=8355 RepID=A0A974DJV7_XENLA|nr:hypothetical protein XELAEV_18016437mg [Xenopus laevis]